MASSLSSLIWLVTGRCNLSCSHCYAERFQGQDELSPIEAASLVEDAARAGVQHLGLVGGEPLLRPDLLRLVQQARSLNMSVSMVTNGSRITAAVAGELAASEVVVVVSLDGARPGTHDRRRGAGSHQQALSALGHLKQEEVNFRTVTALDSGNYREVGECLTLSQTLGSEAACLIPVMPSGRAEQDGLLSAAQMILVLEAAERCTLDLGLQVQLWCTPFAPLVTSAPEVSTYPCRGADSMDIDPSGRVLLCDVLDTKVSHIRDKGVRGAWREQRRSTLVRSLTGPSITPVCTSCSLSKSCRGGCFARAQLLSDDLNAPDPLCPRVAGAV